MKVPYSCVATTLVSVIVQNWIRPPDQSARRRALKHRSATSRDTTLAMAQAYRRPSLEHSLTRSLMGGAFNDHELKLRQIPAQSDQSINDCLHAPLHMHGSMVVMRHPVRGFTATRMAVAALSVALLLIDVHGASVATGAVAECPNECSLNGALKLTISNCLRVLCMVR